MEPAWDTAGGPRPRTPSIRVWELSWPGPQNPCPPSEGADGRNGPLLEEGLSPTRLQALTQADDLSAVSMLELCVDTRECSLGSFGLHLPGLSQLKLNGSRLASIRDLGTSLGCLRVLWLARCGLADLDGVGSFPALKVVPTEHPSGSTTWCCPHPRPSHSPRGGCSPRTGRPRTTAAASPMAWAAFFAGTPPEASGSAGTQARPWSPRGRCPSTGLKTVPPVPPDQGRTLPTTAASGSCPNLGPGGTCACSGSRSPARPREAGEGRGLVAKGTLVPAWPSRSPRGPPEPHICLDGSGGGGWCRAPPSHPLQPLPCRPLVSWPAGAAALQSPQRGPGNPEGKSEPETRLLRLAPAPAGGSGSTLVPSPPRGPMPPAARTSSWGPANLPLGGRRLRALRGLGPGSPGASWAQGPAPPLRTLAVAAGPSPHTQGYTAPNSTPEPPAGPLRGAQHLNPITAAHSHP
ncbi:leucine-rich repeat-containing protein 56 isoform X6 [Tamandua tetradactyla]|uniref:leucine-rich repeat-containing protein 56 isoform X6 n=1 Tax=Tamandua tetradactyla TaxID=48850 RepID=UPI00405419FD